MKIKILSLLLCVCPLIISCQKEEPATRAVPPPKVDVYLTKAQDVPIYQTYVGQIYGAKDIAIRARVEGFLNGIHFQEGAQVVSGSLLYTIESQPFEAQVAAQEGLVAEANTLLIKARSDLARYRPLAEKNAVSQSDLDAAEAQYQAAQASVDAAKANLRAAQIQMGYTKVYSPITGIIGKTEAKVGDFVGREPNPVILNTVSNTEQILVEFFLSETQYLKLARQYLAEKKEKGNMDEDEDRPMELILADGSLYPHKGHATFIDRTVDPMTGAILVQAAFPNPDGLIRPGQFAKVKIMIQDAKDSIIIPQRCVSELQGISRVFVVDEKNTVQERKVVLGPKMDNFWLIQDGLNPGEKVVYEGLQKIGHGVVAEPVEKQVERIKQDGL